MKHRRNPVGNDLPVGVGERDVEREVDARTRHHLPFERIAMYIDDTRQQQETVGIDCAFRAAFRADFGNDAVIRVNAGLHKLVARQHLCVGNADVHLPTQ